MQTQTDSEDVIICPQTTSVIVTILKILGVLSFLFNGTNFNPEIFGYFINPIISIIVTLFIILGIKHKNYGYYNCAQITCIVFSIIESIVISIYLLGILFLGWFFGQIIKNIPNEPKDTNKRNNDTTNYIAIIIIIGLSLNLFFIWLLTCVLIGYNKRVRNYCNNITTKQINNVINQPLV